MTHGRIGPEAPSSGLRPPDWRDYAACRPGGPADVHPELFFPISKTDKRIKEAVDVCVTCPVRVNCLQFAMSTGQDAGIWGGFTEDERRLAKRRKQYTRENANRRSTR